MKQTDYNSPSKAIHNTDNLTTAFIMKSSASFPNRVIDLCNFCDTLADMQLSNENGILSIIDTDAGVHVTISK